jgi:predicted metal-binding protein
MRATSMAPRLHLFVCANRRPSDSPLGPGCANAGDALFEALKSEVALRRQFAEVWVTKTACLGICPREGATLAAYAPTNGGHIYTEAQVSDAAYLYEQELSAVDAHAKGRG